MPSAIDDDGRIKLECTIKPTSRKMARPKRQETNLVAKKAELLGIDQNGKWISKVVKAIHPFPRKKPCQTCGELCLSTIFIRQKCTKED
jgi:hypothetical protein